MEQRTATIPFDLETAKKINIGEIAGRIVTEKGQNRAEIVYALIYKLSKLDCVNFIEMTEGYLSKTCIFVSN